MTMQLDYDTAYECARIIRQWHIEDIIIDRADSLEWLTHEYGFEQTLAEWGWHIWENQLAPTYDDWDWRLAID